MCATELFFATFTKKYLVVYSQQGVIEISKHTDCLEVRQFPHIYNAQKCKYKLNDDLHLLLYT